MFRRHQGYMPRHFYAYNQQPFRWMNDINQMNPYNMNIPQQLPLFHQMGSGFGGGYNPLSYSAFTQPFFDQSPFAGPFQTPQQNTNSSMEQPNWGGNEMSFMNPYPVQSMPFQQQKQFSNFLNQFKGQDGSLDMKKMMDTAGQMLNTVNQLNGLLKGITSTFKA